MGTGMKVLGMRPAATGKFAIGSVLVMALGLVSCSSNVSRFDYPMFAAGESTDNSLTTASVNPVPAEPVYQGESDYRGDSGYYGQQGYRGASNQTVVKSELPPPSGQPASQPAYGQPAPSQPYAARSYPQQRYASAQPVQSPPTQPRPQAAPAARAPLPAPEPKTTEYRVESGDTLARIARKHDVSVASIMSANKLSNTRLSIDQKLLIPDGGAADATVKTAGKESVYKVRGGDTLSSIAKRYDMGYRELASHNGLRETSVLSLGQEIRIPGGSASQAPVKVASNDADAPLPGSRPSVSESPEPPAAEKTRVAAKPRPKVQNASLPSPAPMTDNSFRWPVRGRVISNFGGKPNGKHNDGINVAVPLGTSVKAAENGVVAYAGSELEGYGNLILIRHANGWVSAYAHNDEILVKRGDEVRRGQVISKAGKTGSVSQPQVHFELRKGSQPVDPLKHLANG